MLDLRNIVECVMVFIIAFLINQHLYLKQEYETLKVSCSESEKCHCLNGEKMSGLAQSSTIPSLLIMPSQSQQARQMYWMDRDDTPSDSESLPLDMKSQSKSIVSIISSSYPPNDVVKARETVTVETGSSDVDSKESRSEGVKATLIPETELVREDNIPSIQSSDDISFRVKKGFKNTVNSSLSQSSDSALSSLHTPTTLLSLEENEKEEVSNNHYDYNLPVEQTHSSAILNDNPGKDQVQFPSIIATEESDGATPNNNNRDVFQTSVSSDIAQGVTQSEMIYDTSLHESTASSTSAEDEGLTLLSTEAQDIHANRYEPIDEADEVVRDTDNVPSPHKPFSNYHESTVEGTDFWNQGKDVRFNEIKWDGDVRPLSRGTSASCKGTSLGKRHCVFQNICYSPDKNDFVFFKGPDSVVESDATLSSADYFTMSLSTLSEHNALKFSLVTLPVEILSSFSLSLISTKSIAVTRFKPDNIMHVLHDDILPLYHTLREFGFSSEVGAFDAVFLFTDDHDNGDYFEIYSSLSSFKPLSRNKLSGTQQLICFADIHVGLSTSTVWYQYGFFKPQGPLPDIDRLAFPYIQEASRHLGKRFKADCFLCKQKDYMVMLSRKDNRLMLNEGELIMALSKATRLKVLSVSLETQSLAEVITIVKSSRGIIGMHGSLMAVTIFLPPGGAVIELFPFAVNPSRYTPFKMFTELPGSFLVYRSWVNSEREKSVPHPEWDPEEGGIKHLPSPIQKEIESQEEVPEHLCCNDPSWLYHIYQDTYVNISAVVSLTLQALETQSSTFSHSYTQPLSTLPDIPGSVENMHCERNATERLDGTEKDNVFTVLWTSHWALEYHPSPQTLRYEVIVQERNSDSSDVTTLGIDVLSYSFDSFSSSPDSPVYNVWISVIAMDSGTRGQSKYISCQ